MGSDFRPSAVLWDFDGTLLDTEKLWIASQADVLAEHGLAWSFEEGRQLCGASAEVSLAAIYDHAERHGVQLPAEPEELWRKVHEGVKTRLAEGLPWLPGVEALLAALADLGVPMAIVSASPADLLAAGVAQMPAGLFQTIISGPEMPRGKPAPDSYLMAVDRLGVAASDCIVIEDSVPGITAGLTAGAVVIAVPNLVPLPTAPGQLNLDSLAGLRPADLTKIWHEMRDQLNASEVAQ